jgi:exodeoxyribonuclease-3
MLRIISVNLNGIRSAWTKGFFEWLQSTQADVVCLQELKAQEEDLSPEMRNPAGYHGYFHCAQKKGYSGVGIYCRRPPDRLILGFGNNRFDAEGRFIQADFGDLSIASVYAPSGSSSPERQEAKFEFLDIFLPVMNTLLTPRSPSTTSTPPTCVVCGDWNIAHQAIDLKNWKGNLKNSGFLPEEREWLSRLYASGWTDVYRHLYPQATEEGYTWWSQRGQAYAKNVGWRIDLHVATAPMALAARSASIYKNQRFSDHAPVIIDYDGSF